jgi:hypothetical protein
MEETIRIRPVDKTDWSHTLDGFQPDRIQQLLAVCSTGGMVVGNICESVEGKYYLNGQPEVEYLSLQAAAEALIRGKRERP